MLLACWAGLGGVSCSGPALAAVFNPQLVTNLPAAGGAAFSSNPTNGVAMGGVFYFSATDGPNGSNGRELWRSDGTAAGTTLLKDINPGPPDSSPGFFTAAGTQVFFFADDGVHGNQLWKSDGTGTGTVLVASITPSPANSDIRKIVAAGNQVYFQIGTNLWVSDGTSGGTVELVGPSGSLTSLPLQAWTTGVSNAVFATLDSASVNTLWRTDGTVPGTVQLESVGVTNGFITAIAVVDPMCYYRAVDSQIDNTGAETDSRYLLRRSLNPGPPSQLIDHGLQYCDTNNACNNPSDILNLQSINGRLYYVYQLEVLIPESPPDFFYSNNVVANNSSTPVTLPLHSENLVGVIFGSAYFWSLTPGGSIIERTDGTVNGTVVSYNFTAAGFQPSAFEQAGTRFFFTGTSNFYSGLGVSDLTPGGTRVLSGLPCFLLGSLGSNTFFAANDGINGMELWYSDGTPGGTGLLKDIASGGDSPPPFEAVPMGTNLVLSVPSAVSGIELWKSDGTAAGTSSLRRFGSTGFGPTNLTAANGLVYFAAADSTNSPGLWRSDGTPAGTVLLRSFVPPTFNVPSFVACNGSTYFAANDGTNGMELWRSDGTPAGTYMVRDCRVGPAGSNPSQLTAGTSLLFFVADDGAHGAELWVSDGTSNGTYMAQDIVPGLDSSQIGDMGAVGNTAYFIAKSGSLGRELWTSTGQPGGTQFLKQLCFGTNDAAPGQYTAFAGAVYFINNTITNGLWRTDGTPEGTVLVVSGSPGQISVLTNGSSTNYLFYATGTQLWQTDGTTPGTFLLTNLPSPVVQSSASGGLLYSADNTNLWSTDGTGQAQVAADFGSCMPPMFSPSNLVSFQGALVFTAGGPPFGREFWATAPGQTATLIEDFEPGITDANIRFIVPAADRIYYVARLHGQGSWQVRTLRLQSLAPPPKAPWGGVRWQVPVQIPAVNFDLGGEGQGYHDLTIVNEGGLYRKTEAVDIYACDDTNGGFCVGGTQPGEWMEYTIQTPADGFYEVDVRLAAAADGGAFHFAVDGTSGNGGSTLVPNTSNTWTTVTVYDLLMSAGVHVLRLAFDSPNTNGDVGRYNWLQISLALSNQPPAITILTPQQGAVLPTNQTITLAASIYDPTTVSGPQANFFIDGQSVGTLSQGPYNLAWNPTPGAHVFRVTATDSFGLSGTSQGRLFFVAPPVLTNGSFWRYSDFGTNAGTIWRSLAFNDNSWPRGSAPLGFGYPNQATILRSIVNSKAIVTYYFRQSFTNNLSTFNYGYFTLTRADGAVVYLNGQEIARPDMPRTNILFNTLALTNVLNGPGIYQGLPAVDSIPVPLALLTAANKPNNLIAVELHQALPGPHDSLDATFDLAFSGVSYSPGAVLQLQVAGTNAVVQWPDYLSDWFLEQSSDLVSWAAVTGTTPNISGGTATLQVPLQSLMFFRLHQVGAP